MAMTWIPFAFPGVTAVRCAFHTRCGGASQAPWGKGNISLEVGDAPDATIANRRELSSSITPFFTNLVFNPSTNPMLSTFKV